jgi:hypothetical protein
LWKYTTTEENLTSTQSTITEIFLPQKLLNFCVDNSISVIGNFVNIHDEGSKQYLTALQSVQQHRQQIGAFELVVDDPYSQIAVPFYSDGNGNGDVNTTMEKPVASVVAALLRWKTYLEHISKSKIGPDTGVYELVLSSSCGDSEEPTKSISYTYRSNGTGVLFVGHGDLHDSQWDIYKRQIPHVIDLYSSFCPITLTIYPTAEFFATNPVDEKGTNLQAIVLLVVAICLFISIGIVVAVHDYLVERRHDLVLSRAALSTTLVSSLFPGEIATRVMNHQTRDNTSAAHQVSNNKYNMPSPTKSKSSQSHSTSNNLNQASDGSGNNSNLRSPIKFSKIPPFANNRIDQDPLATNDDDARNQSNSTKTTALALRFRRSGTSSDDDDDQSVSSNEPIADLFPNTVSKKNL